MGLSKNTSLWSRGTIRRSHQSSISRGYWGESDRLKKKRAFFDRPLMGSEYIDQTMARLKSCRRACRFVFTAVLLLTLSCFRMGMPERFSTATEGASAPSMSVGSSIVNNSSALERLLNRRALAGTAVVVLPNGFAAAYGIGATAQPKILGHQWVFGVIPLTRLFFQHNAESVMLESLRDVLQEERFRCLLVAEADLPSVVPLVRPDLIISPRLKEVSVSAYDVFFFRVVSLGAELTLDLMEWEATGKSAPLRRFNKMLSSDAVKRYAHADMLASEFTELLQDGIYEGVRQLIVWQSEVPRRSPSRAKPPLQILPGKEPLLTVLRPEFAKPPPPLLGELLASSYGIARVPSFSMETILRLVQRGTEAGLAASGAKVVSSSSRMPGGVMRFQGRGVQWELYAAIETIAPDPEDRGWDAEALRLRIRYRLQERSVSGVSLLSDAVCEVVQPLTYGVDGPWVFAVEEAAVLLAGEVLSGRALAEGSHCVFR